MALQLTRLNVPNLTTDYSAETNAAARLGQTLGSLPAEWRKQQEAATKRQALLGIGEDIKAGNYQGAAAKAFGLGDIQGGAALLGQATKASDRDYDQKLFSGGSAPTTTLGASPTAALGNPNEIENTFVGTVKQAGLTNPVGLGAVAAYGKAESGFSPQNVNRVWNDPSESGQPGQSGGIMSWRGPRLEALKAFARERGEDAPSVPTQALFLAKEDPSLIPRLNAAQTPQEANRIMADAWRFAGYNRPGGENARRESLTTQYAQRYAGQGAPQQAAAPAPQGVQVAETEADTQRLEAQMPGYGGQQPQMAQAPVGGGGVYAGVDAATLNGYLNNPRVPANLKSLVQQELASRQGGGAPVQVAQAPAQPGAPVSDAANQPAPGANAAQGFAIPGGVTPQQAQTLSSDPKVQEWSRKYGMARTENGKAFAKTQLDLALADAKQRMEGSKPTEQTRNFDAYRREEIAAGRQPLSRLEFLKAQRTTINNTNSLDAKGESKFNEALGSAQAKRWNSYIEEGDVAQARLADIQTLRETSRRLGSQGSSANLKATIGPYAESLGIKVDGLPDIQLYESITNRLAPTLRAPGSGSTSDIEFKGFQRAIGPLSNNPAAREMILDTFEAASRNDVARSQIASRLASGEISRGDAEKELRALPNPLQAFREFRKANPDAVGEAIKEAGRKDEIDKRGPPKITSPEQALKLPSGTEFIDPNGIKRRVP